MFWWNGLMCKSLGIARGKVPGMVFFHRGHGVANSSASCRLPLLSSC
jgi:hypothetical protein